MIKVKNLVKEFRNDTDVLRAIDDVSFEVNKGEVFGIIGLSGAGKSTLVRCLNRLEEPTSGTIEIDGVCINDLDKKSLLEARRSIGMIFQNFNLFNQSTVYENIAYPLEIIGMDKKEIEETVEEMLDFVDLKDKKNSYPSEISGGQKQRVAIARALATKPKILLSDESTSALDPANTEQILNLLKSSVERYNMTIIMITHQMEVAKSICDRIAVMEDGRIIETDTVENIFKSPKTERTKSFIKSLPDVLEDEVFDPEDFKGKLLRLSFDSSTAKRPIMNDLIKTSNCTVNLLSGNINRLRNGDVSGYLTIELDGSPEDIEAAIDALTRQNVVVEVL
ncbi:MAG: methionine ABC transporter ATP-binding protein [Tissierellaceae bacterium]|jgi:D-methionine transport system ATP-binding protein|nr:methionine ABC transporter ATP-binding protein [Tissierellia bacterium]